jgi:hypothetical protein
VERQHHIQTAGHEFNGNKSLISLPSTSEATFKSLPKIVVRLPPSGGTSAVSACANHVARTSERAPLQVAPSRDERSTVQSPLFVPEQSPSEDSDTEDIARQGLIRAQHLTDAPNSPTDSVLTESSPLARWERRKLPLDQFTKPKSQPTSSSIGKDDGQQEPNTDTTTLPADLQIASLSRGPTTPIKVSTKRPRPQSTAMDCERPVKLRCERGPSVSSATSSRTPQRGPSIMSER